MEVFAARQAIFNSKKNVVGYELLYRDSENNAFPVGTDPHKATVQLIQRTHLNTGLADFTSGKPALINFTEKCLLSKVPEMLPKKEVVIEILESVRPTDEVFERCKELFHKGYSLALDDFIYKKEWDRFFNLVKIIKFDIQKTPLKDIAPLIRKMKGRKSLKFLAERVETVEQFNEAKEMGFNFFQGYFFCVPEIRKMKDVSPNAAILVELYNESLREGFNVNRLMNTFQRDVGLSYKLLSYINSGVFSTKQPISSIRQAIVYLGEDETRKLMSLLITSELAHGKPKEIMRTAVIRARASELTCEKVSPGLTNEAFLTGLLSMLPAILDRDINTILEQISVSDEIKVALADPKDQSVLKIIHSSVLLYEQGKWHDTTKELFKIRMDYDEFSKIYTSAIKWSDSHDPS